MRLTTFSDTQAAFFLGWSVGLLCGVLLVLMLYGKPAHGHGGETAVHIGVVAHGN